VSQQLGCERAVQSFCCFSCWLVRTVSARPVWAWSRGQLRGALRAARPPCQRRCRPRCRSRWGCGSPGAHSCLGCASPGNGYRRHCTGRACWRGRGASSSCGKQRVWQGGRVRRGCYVCGGHWRRRTGRQGPIDITWPTFCSRSGTPGQRSSLEGRAIKGLYR
jgi:hypothetical protein